MPITEASLETRLAEINTAISLALTGAPFDHQEGDFKVQKAAFLAALFAERKRLEDALARVPAVAVHQEDYVVGPWGGESAVFRGDTES